MPQARNALAALRGSIPPLITPFMRGAVDYERYAELVEFQIEQGSHGILVNGTTAEPSTLTTDERNRLVTLAVKTTKGRVPVVAATGSQSLAESRELTEHALTAGADCAADRHALLHSAAATRSRRVLPRARCGTRLPWMVYHIPGRTAVGVTLDTLKAVKERSPNFVGMKHAVNDLGFVSECLHEFGERLQNLRRPRGAQLPDDDGRRLRPDERRRQSAAEGARANVRGRVRTPIWRRASACTSSCSRSTRPCSSTRTRSR